MVRDLNNKKDLTARYWTLIVSRKKMKKKFGTFHIDKIMKYQRRLIEEQNNLSEFYDDICFASS